MGCESNQAIWIKSDDQSGDHHGLVVYTLARWSGGPRFKSHLFFFFCCKKIADRENVRKADHENVRKAAICCCNFSKRENVRKQEKRRWLDSNHDWNGIGTSNEEEGRSCPTLQLENWLDQDSIQDRRGPSRGPSKNTLKKLIALIQL